MADIIGDDTKMAHLQTDPAGEDRRDVSDAGYEEGDDDVTSSGKSDSRRSISPEDDVERPVGSGLSNGAGEGATGGPDFDTGEESPLSEDGAVAAENDMPADAELSAILSRRCNINDALEEGRDLRVKNKIFNVYNEFNEFSIKEIKSFTDTFRKWDVDKDGFLDLTELKRMMEALGAPQTHLGLKQMISDGGNQEKEGAISFREFLYILRRARAGEFDESSGLNNMAKLTEVNVEEVGVGGAKSFFEAKIMEQTQASKFEAEIKADKEEKQRQAEEAKKRRAAFKNKANFFETGAPSPAI